MIKLSFQIYYIVIYILVFCSPSRTDMNLVQFSWGSVCFRTGLVKAIAILSFSRIE